MEENIKISIILPIYNVGPFFEECMKSVIGQTYKNLEIVLVDDGSTDNSGDIADHYAKIDNRIKVIHQSNKGVSNARNTGIDNSTGEYICFSDPDDILRPDYVEYLLNLCLEYNVEISVCAEVLTPFMRNQPQPNIKLISGEDAATEILYGRITVGCYSKMFCRSMLNREKVRFFENVNIGEGFNFNVLAFCSVTRVAISQHKVYYYRLDNAESAMSKFNIKKCEMGIEAINMIRKNLLIKSPKLISAVDFAEYSTIGSMYDWLVMAGVKKQYPFYHNMWKLKLKNLSWKALQAPTSSKLKIAAFIRIISPSAWAYLRLIARSIVLNK